MNESRSRNGQVKERGVLDYLFFALASSVLAAFTFSFLLWLRF